MSVPRYGHPLGPRELEILQLASQGLSYGEAARQVRPAISENTAKAHMQRVLVKLGANSAPQAVLLACRAGLLDGQRRRHGDHAGFAAHERRGEDPKACLLGCWEGELAYRAAQRAVLKARQRA